jgi:hypothetical protein
MKRKEFRHSYKTFKAFFNKDIIDTPLGAKVVFSLVLGLFEDKAILTKDDVCKANSAKRATTYAYLRILEDAGFLTSERTNEYYSKSYIQLTEKGNLTASRLRRILAQP